MMNNGINGSVKLMNSRPFEVSVIQLFGVDPRLWSPQLDRAT